VNGIIRMEILKFINKESRKMIMGLSEYKKELEKMTEELLLIDYGFLIVMMLLEFIKQSLILAKKILRKVGKYDN